METMYLSTSAGDEHVLLITKKALEKKHDLA